MGSYNGHNSGYHGGVVGGSGYNPGLGFGAIYPGYYGDLELLIKLGQAALIVFIVFAIIAVVFMLVLACLYCVGGQKRRERRRRLLRHIQARLRERQVQGRSQLFHRYQQVTWDRVAALDEVAQL